MLDGQVIPKSQIAADSCVVHGLPPSTQAITTPVPPFTPAAKLSPGAPRSATPPGADAWASERNGHGEPGPLSRCRDGGHCRVVRVVGEGVGALGRGHKVHPE